MNNMLQKIEKLSPPSNKDLSHHFPEGKRRTIINSKIPAGKARSIAIVNGYPSGKNSVVTKYVLPHIIGAMAVSHEVL